MRGAPLPAAVSESYESGITPGSGTFACVECGAHLSLGSLEELPPCPRCDGREFRRPPMFEALEEQTTEATSEFSMPEAELSADWRAAARKRITEAGRYLVYLDDDLELFQISRGWTRIGRSVNADLRLDDPTVSRRHAIVVWEDGSPLRVLDDRSLNGILLNGDLVDWATMADGDELTIGRYRLVVLEAE